MPAPRVYDYRVIYEEFVQGDATLSDLARKHGIKSVSTLTRRARAERWAARREEFRRQLDDKTMAEVADKRAKKISDIHMDTLEVIHAGILKLAQDMQAEEPVFDAAGQLVRNRAGEPVFKPAVRYSPRDLATLIDKFLLLTGQPNERTEERHLGISISAAADKDDLNALLAALRPRAALANGGSETP